MRNRRLAAALAISAVLACATPGVAVAAPSATGGNGYVSWKTSADVVRGLKAHGFTCKKDGTAPDVSPGIDMNGKPSKALALISCDGYTVVLVKDAAKAHALERAECKAATAEDWARFAVTKGLTGKNFYVISPADNHSFPAHAQPSDFQKAFGGIVETDAQYLSRMYGCKRPAA